MIVSMEQYSMMTRIHHQHTSTSVDESQALCGPCAEQENSEHWFNFVQELRTNPLKACNIKAAGTTIKTVKAGRTERCTSQGDMTIVHPMITVQAVTVPKQGIGKYKGRDEEIAFDNVQVYDQMLPQRGIWGYSDVLQIAS
ncbi:uncharacterized protein MELLADRAFT_110652 [Melampsora larici-populina 98AG31]|uniref:Uncharacterized protein n=1 Tax=Melampsora larici-populina (strain 98AG31 / pathotype 3-4-7) TaxID=747676 RepID=F4S0I0_MELLP|nr:uncharacterized protein MELLADRAFT_110652 [Melampsora larici-populina 98AG31]EGG01866.1 hypothetical protein MELLADRAFT_110652 [Melampsora larici-populina 98AG31]